MNRRGIQDRCPCFDCPRRSELCRTSCTEWAEWEAMSKADCAKRRGIHPADAYLGHETAKRKREYMKRTGKI